MRIAVALVVVLIGVAVYAMTYANLGVLYDGCLPRPGFGYPVDNRGSYKSFPPGFVCRYRTKDGRIVERRN